ncbi:23587_t:CDS:2, partial [Racocetra persica]
YASPEAGPDPRTQAHHEGRLTKLEEIVTQQTTLLDNIELQPVQKLPIHEEGFLDLDVETAKNMFKVDGAEYAFLTWFIEVKEIGLASVILGAENEDKAMQEVFLQCLFQNYSEEEINKTIKLAVDAYRAFENEAGMTEKRAQRILNTIDNYEYLIRVKFIRDDTVISVEKTKKGFKIIDKYEPIHESKKAGGKYVRGGPNVILTKKMKLGFWLGIDEKFLVKEVSIQSDVERLDNGAFNCIAQRQKIKDCEKKMRIPDARVQDVAELEKILKQPIKLLDITHGTIFNSGKYRSGKYEEIRMVVHNGHAFPRNQHFSRDRMVKYYKGDIWKAISNALREPQAIWLIGVEYTSQTISQFVLEDGCTFRIWKKHTEIIEACKQLVNDTIDWQYQERIINKEKKLILLESLKVVDLAEQHPISGKINENIRQACVEHGHGQRECAPWFNRFGHPTHHLVQVAVNEKLHQDGITRFAQVNSFKFTSNIYSVILVWYRKYFACHSGKGCGKEKGWAPIVLLRYLFEVGILESVTIGEAIISLTKQTK